MFKIIKKENLNPFVTKMVIDAPYIAKKALAGQFIILRTHDYGERIPLTIADYDREKGYVTIIYQKVGKTTKFLDTLNENDFILDFAGPLGKPSKLEGHKKVAVVAGGTGCAIAYPQAKALYRFGSNVDILCGFRSENLIILEKDMKNISNHLMIMTDDGSNGNKGIVTQSLLTKIENKANYDLIISIGPLQMMKAVCDITKKYKIKTIVSMNSIMIDGTGMCGGCRLTVDGKIKFACVDGPDFDGHKVDFNEAIMRSNIYKKQELESLNNYENCKFMKGE